MGVYDGGSDGLTTSHQVGLWTSTGTLLFSGTVPAGTAGTLVQGFRYTSALTGTGSQLLAPGSYVVGAQSQGDQIIYNVTNPTYAPGVAFTGNASNGSSGVFSFPGTTQSGLDVGVFGGNFLIAAVPEPGTWGLMIVGFAAVGAAGRRQRRSTRVPANMR